MNNSNPKEFTVTTVSGNVVPRSRCRFIKKEYYEMNVDCFFMSDSHWHRINNGQIAFDNETQKWVLIEDVYLHDGVIGIDKNNEPIYGKFSPNPLKNVKMNGTMCISDDIPIGLGMVEELATGDYWSPAKLGKGFNNRKAIGSRYSFDLSYSAGPKIKSFTESYEDGYKMKPLYTIKPKFSHELGSTSFGFEVETADGMIAERHCYRNGLIPLRDGSLRHDGIEPFEYTTIPLSGEKGLYTMLDVCDLLNKYTEIGKMCALHLHIGGYKQSKEFVVALHRVMLRIQDEIFEMFPSNYKYTSENGFKAKDYCVPIKNIRLLKSNTVDQNFEVLYNFYSGGNGSFKGFGACNHPLDRENRQKWQISQRYYLENIVPFIWGGSGTVEWRCHVPTKNPHKMLNWLYICNAIMAYVEKNKDDIANWGDLRSVNLEHIMKSVYSEACATELIGYVEWRKNYMKDMDAHGDKELEEDLLTPPYSVLG